MSFFGNKSTIMDVIKKEEKKKKNEEQKSNKQLKKDMYDCFSNLMFWPGGKTSFEVYLGYKLDYIKLFDGLTRIGFRDLSKSNPQNCFHCYDSRLPEQVVSEKLFDEKIIGFVYSSRVLIPVKRIQENK
ncbi:MAG: hypothetical protein ABIC91_01215 [Nanoarchaeota archaeon]|nr:hypothetical protein [Nanoarchaeota archaeon]MBU1029824.1 hypothetical protein [Nanoarchaeota archaeon]MBU1849649.1 hypothetical protein [Nanoarchaeota archaeon]